MLSASVTATCSVCANINTFVFVSFFRRDLLFDDPKPSQLSGGCPDCRLLFSGNCRSKMMMIYFVKM